MNDKTNSQAVGGALEKGVIFAALLQQAPTPMIVTTDEGNIYFINDKAAALLAGNANNLIGQPITNLLGATQSTDWPQLSQSDDETFSYSLTLQGEEAVIYPVQVEIKQVKTESGQFAIYTLNDRSSRQKLESELAHEKQKREQAYNELRNFAYTISHDLRASLRILNTYSRFLFEDFGDSLNEDGIEYLDGIQENSALLSNQIDALREYVRLETAETPALLDLQPILTQLIAKMDLEHTDVITLPPTLPSVYGQEKQLRQIFFHLIDNALKFVSPDRPPKIAITYSLPDDQFVQFSVTDNGIGIEKAYWTKIFDVFYRLHTHEEYPGTGIGLAIVKKAVENHGGNVWLTSELGQGSTFSLTLPCQPISS